MIMSLKEITQDLHLEAEHTTFAAKLISGNITVEEYANYLFQLIPIYTIIEFGNRLAGNLEKLQGLERSQAICLDFQELAGNHHKFIWLPATLNYQQYLIDLINDLDRRDLIKAHLYCRHMGDLYGGQILAKKVPGSGRFYQFENASDLRLQIRSTLTDDLGPEARIAFEHTIKIMKELAGE